MTSLTKFVRFDSEGLELVVNTDTGLAYATVSAVARMLEISKSTASEGVRSYDVINGEIETEGGLQGVRLVSADVVFKLAFKYHPQLAMKMGAVGANLYMLGLAGYKTSIVEAPKTRLQLAEEQVKLIKEIELAEEQIKLLEADNLRQSEAIDELFGYSSIIRIAKFNNCSEKLFTWHKLKAASKIMGLEIKQVPCARYGTKNLYSHDAWRFCYSEAELPEVVSLTIKV